MHENGLASICRLHEVQQVIPGSMPAEVVYLDSTVQGDLREFWVKSDCITRLSGTNLSSA